MPYSVRCKACSAAFAIPDDIWDRRVRGRQATLKCRSCKCDIQVDGTKENAGKLSEAPGRPVPSEPIVAVSVQSKSSEATSPVPSPQPPMAAAQAAPVTPVTSARAPKVESSLGPVATPAPVAVANPISATAPTAHKPFAKAPSEIAAAETGWSLMPPPAQLPEQLPDAQLPTAVAKPAPAPFENVQVLDSIPEQPPSDLWVVSYGEEDDRELTEAQIAAELTRGKINATTIVWREEMPEWLPISGVKELARYLPAPKTPIRSRPTATVAKATSAVAPKTSGVKSPGTATSTSTTKQDGKPDPRPGYQSKTAASPPIQSGPKASTPTAPTATSTVPKQPAPREKQPSASQLGSATPTGAKVTELSAAQGGKSPPPIARATQKSAEKISAATETKSRVPQPGAGKPPTLLGRGAKTDRVEILEATVPYRKAHESSDEVLTSAPNLSLESDDGLDALPDVMAHAEPQKLDTTPSPSAPGNPPPLPAARPKGSAAIAGPAPTPSAATAQAAAQSPEPAATSASSHPSAKASFRPPKPVETATSMVMHSPHAPAADVLSITDDDFLEMQRRFPKWALPAAIGGGVVVVGLIVYAVVSGEEPPPLPVAPVMAPTSANGADGKHLQPDLDAIPTAKSRGPGGAADKDFAKAFAQAANKGSGNFDAKAAERAASSAMERAAKCHAPGETAGQVTATVTLSAAGQVTSVQVGAPHASSATGKCIDKALHGFSVKPFQGDTAKLPLTITLR